MVPSAVSEAIAWSTLLRRKASLASTAAPISALSVGNGVDEIARTLAMAGSACASAQSEGPHTKATPTVPCTNAASAANLLSRALDEPPAPADRPAVLLELGQARARAGSPDAVAPLTEVVEHSDQKE